MKTTNETTPTTTTKPATGRAALIHSLRNAKTSKREAFAKTSEQFAVSKALFDRIWKRAEKGMKSESAKN